MVIFTLRGGYSTSKRESSAHQESEKDIVILTLKLEEQETVDIRLSLFEKQAPSAAGYVKELATNPYESCEKCSLYQGEPVPSYWGSPEYPGRWGPPYALVQGELSSQTVLAVPSPAESYTPFVERGMVAWAGGKGGPHFFIALAQHPEWKHAHTVWAEVLEEDMALVDALLKRPLKTTKRKHNMVSNFVDPIPFTIAIL